MVDYEMMWFDPGVGLPGSWQKQTVDNTIFSPEGNWEQPGSDEGWGVNPKSEFELALMNQLHTLWSDNLFRCTKYLYIICKTVQIETSLNEREFYLNCCNSAVCNEWVLSVHITGVIFWYQLAYQIMMKMKIVQLVHLLQACCSNWRHEGPMPSQAGLPPIITWTAAVIGGRRLSGSRN